MAIVLKPPRTNASVASGVPKIDWSNPITLGMLDCLVWNAGGPPANLAFPSANTTLQGLPTDVMTAEGPAGYSTGGTGCAVF